MGHDELHLRIHRFQEEYLNTPEGREHYQSSLDEREEVRQVYDELQNKRANRIDVTDETLRRLLPHSNTEHNRQRGARVSIWACITKDIVSWFEGAKWKTPDEWFDTSLWLLDIVQAGSEENWELWEDRIQNPVKKGFASGFISPIVHCLNPELPIINSKVVKTYSQIAPKFGLNVQITSKLADYPNHSTPFLLDLIEELKQFGINNLNEWDMYCHWNVSKRLGGADREVEKQKHLIEQERVIESQLITSNVEDLCNELAIAQHDSENYARFEVAIADAFSTLGFNVEHISGPGQADVVVKASLGDQSFSMVVDAKSKKKGKSYSANEGYSQIKSHQEDNAADFAVIIAPNFAGGNTVRFAEDQSICLMPTDDLIYLIRENANSPISLYFLKSLFEANVGLIKIHSESVEREDYIATAVEVLNTFELHQREQDGDIPCLTDDNVFLMLRAQDRHLPKDQVKEAVKFLSNPLLGILEPMDDGYVLTIPAQAGVGRLLAIADKFTNRIGGN